MWYKIIESNQLKGDGGKTIKWIQISRWNNKKNLTYVIVLNSASKVNGWQYRYFVERHINISQQQPVIFT